MVVFQKLEGKTTTLNFWSQKLEGKTTTLIFWNQKLKGKTTTPKNCVLTNFLHERSTIFFLVFSLVWFWILLRNVFYYCTWYTYFCNGRYQPCMVKRSINAVHTLELDEKAKKKYNFWKCVHKSPNRWILWSSKNHTS